MKDRMSSCFWQWQYPLSPISTSLSLLLSFSSYSLFSSFQFCIPNTKYKFTSDTSWIGWGRKQERERERKRDEWESMRKRWGWMKGLMMAQRLTVSKGRIATAKFHSISDTKPNVLFRVRESKHFLEQEERGNRKGNDSHHRELFSWEGNREWEREKFTEVVQKESWIHLLSLSLLLLFQRESFFTISLLSHSFRPAKNCKLKRRRTDFVFERTFQGSGWEEGGRIKTWTRAKGKEKFYSCEKRWNGEKLRERLWERETSVIF